ncbi:serine protease snake-like [Cydia fagiglandana]|uniref:serine protease snake-like n=1 Tax=Cydia fagiglandana TaxID=1458189 RepID=UPI002FEE61E7
MFVLYLVCVCLCVRHGLTQGLGDSCNHDGVPGVCILASGCPSVLADRSKLRSAKRCGFRGEEPIICCTDSNIGGTEDRFVATTPFIRSTTTEYTPPIADYKELVPGAIGDDTCAPVPQKDTADKTGRKAFDKCIEYQEQLVYPCERGVDYTGKKSRGNYCSHNADELIVGGQDAKRDEFPHMVSEQLVYPCERGVDYTGKKSCGNYCSHNADELIVGGQDAKRDEFPHMLVYPCERGVDYTGKKSRGNYCSHNADELIVGGQDAKRDEFPHMALLIFGDGSSTSTVCGGTIISENFILTAGHCTYAPKIGNVTAVKVGLLRMTEDVPRREHRVKRIIKHPQYKAPSKYHDIALLETETPIILGPNAIPACIDIGETVDDSRASATGWGHNKSLGEVLDVLQKVTLQKFTPQECTEKFRNVRHLTQGYDELTQICYGDHGEKKDTCQGDSGGPLQINNARVHCMYTVIGVTSFGRYCGQVGRPGMYSRVSHYARWIESVVWP